MRITPEAFVESNKDKSYEELLAVRDQLISVIQNFEADTEHDPEDVLVNPLVDGNYDGPSLIICYAPCINHGIKKGMGKSQENIKDAVESGYWHLYRYNPERKNEGKNPFILDSAEPTASFKDFIMGQIRYSSLAKEFPSIADKLFDQVEEDARQKYETYKALAENDKALF